ncbi:TPA: hypothetical protein ACN35N_004435 [Vibrio parahaemolyticus]
MQEKAKEEIKQESTVKGFDSWLHAKSIALIVLSGAIAIRLYDSKIEIAMDTATLLSILLALFSVALSAMFYFKATETSNKFYDNSYRYTKDVAELLVKIESGFGERLKNLDEGYSSMREQIQNSSSLENAIQQTKIHLKAEQEDIDKIKNEKDELLKKLFESSKLRKEEKESLASELEARDHELKESQRELAKLSKKLFVERMEKREASEDTSQLKSRVTSFTLSNVIPQLPEFEHLTLRTLNNSFDEILPTLPSEFAEDLISLGYLRRDVGKLTRKGQAFIRHLARDI